MIGPALLCAALTLGQLDGGTVAPQADAPREATAVVAVSYTLADGGVVSVAADGGTVAVVLTPDKALALANERQQKDWELAAARSEAVRPQQISTVAIVVGVIKTILDAVPVVVSVVQAARQP